MSKRKKENLYRKFKVEEYGMYEQEHYFGYCWIKSDNRQVEKNGEQYELIEDIEMELKELEREKRQIDSYIKTIKKRSG